MDNTLQLFMTNAHYKASLFSDFKINRSFFSIIYNPFVINLLIIVLKYIISLVVNVKQDLYLISISALKFSETIVKQWIYQ